MTGRCAACTNDTWKDFPFAALTLTVKVIFGVSAVTVMPASAETVLMPARFNVTVIGCVRLCVGSETATVMPL